MIVTPSASVNEITISDGHGPALTIVRGQKVEVPMSKVLPFIESGALVKTEYPEIRNNEVAGIPWRGWEE